MEMIQQCYKKAEIHARNAADPKLQVRSCVEYRFFAIQISVIINL